MNCLIVVLNFNIETADTKRLNSKVSRTNLQDRGYDVLFRFILRVPKASWKPIKLARLPPSIKSNSLTCSNRILIYAGFGPPTVTSSVPTFEIRNIYIILCTWISVLSLHVANCS